MAVLLGAINYSDKELQKQLLRLESRKRRLDNSIRQGKPREVIEANKFVFLKKLKEVEKLMQK